jgi:FkbM family methyltransferase
MFPELLSQAIIEALINDFDTNRQGAAIEIGVGTDNYYSVKYKQAGLKCIAVDPIAWPPFLKIADKNDIHFEEACIYDQETELTLFLNDHSDLSSLNHDWWGVDGSRQKKVKAILLKTLLNKYKVDKITFLKADTEGSEYEILKQLKDLSDDQLPYVVEFEYGGGGLKQSGLGGWSDKYFDKVKSIILLLKGLGYQQGLIIDSNVVMPVIVDLQTVTDAGELFKSNFDYGNFLAFKKPVQNLAALENLLLNAQAPGLEQVIDTLQSENRALKIKVLKLQYFTRFVNKIKSLLGKPKS